MRKFWEKLFRLKKKETRERDFEWEKFQAVAKEQFRILKEKGINLPIMTL